MQAIPHDLWRKLLIRKALLFFGLLLLAGLLYANSDHDAFLFDSRRFEFATDSDALLKNLHALLTRPWNPSVTVTQITYAVNSMVGSWLGYDAPDVTVLLVGNVLIHAINGLLVCVLLRHLLKLTSGSTATTGWIAVALAVVFVVHPLQAGSVAYIVQRRGALATTFYLLGMLAYLGARSSPTGVPGTGLRTRWPWRRVALALAVPVCYAASFHSKSLGLTLPVAIMMTEFALRSVDPAAHRAYLKWLVPGLLVAATGMFAFLWQRELFDPDTFEIRSFGDTSEWSSRVHMMTESRVFIHYWKLLLLPLPAWSTIDHHVELSNHLFERGAGLAMLFHAALLISAVLAARRGAVLFAIGVFWFYTALIPYFALPQSELMVEYKTYLPGVGYMMILAEVLRRLNARFSPRPLIAITAVATILLAGTTVYRNRIYQSRYDLWSDAVAKTDGRKARSLNNLGSALMDMDRMAEAAEQFEKCLQIKPDWATPRMNLALAQSELGHPEKALETMREAVRYAPHEPYAYFQAGKLLTETGHEDEAVTFFLEAVELDPEHVEALNELGLIMNRRGRPTEAIVYYARAAHADPANARVFNNWGLALMRLEQYAEAVERFRAAVERDPAYARAHANLGLALESSGYARAAEQAYRRAIELDPEDASSHNYLGALLGRSGRIEAALPHFERALELDPGHPDAARNLDAARRALANRRSDAQAEPSAP